MAAWTLPGAQPLGRRIVSFDVETTDFPHLPTTRMIEVGAVEILDGQLSDSRFASYIACNEPSVPGAFEKHKLTIDKLMADGRPIHEVLADFLAFIGDSPLMCHGRHHGVNCDEEVVNNELRRQGLPNLTNTIVQTTDIFGFVTLERLCGFFGVPSTGAHNALRDAEMLAQCYLTFQHTGFPEGLPVRGAATSFQYVHAGALHSPYVTGQLHQRSWWPSPESDWRWRNATAGNGAGGLQWNQHPGLLPADQGQDRVTLPTPQHSALASRSKNVDLEKLTALQQQVLAQLMEREQV